MNGSVARKIRKETHKAAQAAGWEYVEHICKYPFTVKLRYCWHILTHGVKK